MIQYKPFLVEDDHHGDKEADEEDDSDGDEDHGIEEVWVTCRVKRFS